MPFGIAAPLPYVAFGKAWNDQATTKESASPSLRTGAPAMLDRPLLDMDGQGTRVIHYLGSGAAMGVSRCPMLCLHLPGYIDPRHCASGLPVQLVKCGRLAWKRDDPHVGCRGVQRDIQFGIPLAVFDPGKVLFKAVARCGTVHTYTKKRPARES